MTSTGKRAEDVLKFVKSLQILLFLNDRSIAHFCGCAGWGGGGGGVLNKCMSPKQIGYVVNILIDIAQNFEFHIVECNLCIISVK